MDNLNLKIEEIKQVGFLGASILNIMRENQSLRTSADIASVLYFTCTRQIENELSKLNNRGLIMYHRTKDREKHAFMISNVKRSGNL